MRLHRNAFLALPALLCLAAGALAARGAASPAAARSQLDDLAWLQGTWRVARDKEGFEEETWSSPAGDAMSGMFRRADADGRVTLYEIMAIELEGAPGGAPGQDGPGIPGQERGAPKRLVLRLRHFDRGLQPWKSEAAGALSFSVKSVGEREIVFEDPAREFPREVVYRRAGETLTIRLVSATDKRPDMEFALQRVAN